MKRLAIQHTLITALTLAVIPSASAGEYEPSEEWI